MAKSPKKNSSQGVSLEDVYKMLNGNNFTEDLWMDMLVDIKEKPTYKRMKEMVTSAINNKLKDFQHEPVDQSERLKRRAALTEISMMAYTVDRVISEMLYKRLQNEFKTLISDMLEELQTKKPVEKSNTVVKMNSLLENIESIFSKQSPKKEIKVAKSPKKVATPPARKRGRPPGSRNKIISKESSTEKDDDDVSLDSVSSVHTDDLSSFDDNVSVCTDDENSGIKKKVVSLKKANSMIVEGRLSQIYQLGKKGEKVKAGLPKAIKSQGTKIHKIAESLSKKANKAQGFDKEDKKVKGLAKEAKKPQGLDKEAKKTQGMDKEAKKTQGLDKEAKKTQGLDKEAKKPQGVKAKKAQKKPSLKASPRKVLPQRERKPNKKYNSETMYYQSMDYFSDRSEGTRSNPADDIATIQSQVKKAKLMKTSSDDAKKVSDDSPVSNQSPVKKAKLMKTSSDDDKKVSDASPVKDRSSLKSSSDSDAFIYPNTPNSSTKRYDASDLYKPRFHFGSNCSTRGTDAAYNVFQS